MYLFIVACFFAGIGGALGSIVGNAAGGPGLWIGGVAGGLLGVLAAAAIARGRGWIAPARFHSTAVGAMISFLAATTIAVNTLSSPVGPILATLLVGIGALLGAGKSIDRGDAARAND